MAKACGVKVLQVLHRLRARSSASPGARRSTSVALLPLGGYVKMAGDDRTRSSAGGGHAASWRSPPGSAAPSSLAGPAFNLVFPVLVYFFVFVGATRGDATRRRRVEPGLPAAGGLRPGDRMLAVDGEEVRDASRTCAAFIGRWLGQPSLIVCERDGQPSPLRGDADTRRGFVADRHRRAGLIGVEPGGRRGGRAPGLPGGRAGLRTFDRVLAVNGVAREGREPAAPGDALGGRAGSPEVRAEAAGGGAWCPGRPCPRC